MNYKYKYNKYKTKFSKLLQMGGQIDKLEDLLTVVITTSPIISNPDTTLFMNTFDSINKQKNLNLCKKLVYCDGFEVVTEEDIKIHRKKGKINSKNIDSYLCFIDKLKRLNLSNTEIIEQPQRFGFVGNVKQSLYKVTTPLVMIVQHDHFFSREVNILDIATKMYKNLDNINYMGFPSKSVDNLVNKYRDKDYIKFRQDLEKMLNKDLTVDNLKDYYNGLYDLKLIPLNFWYDRIHIANVKYYKDFVFNEEASGVKVKNFIEDTFGKHQLEDIKTNGLNGFNRYKSFIIYDKEEHAVTHSDGANYLTPRQKLERQTVNKLELTKKYVNSIDELLNSTESEDKNIIKVKEYVENIKKLFTQ